LYSSGLASARAVEEAKNDFLVKQAEDKRARSILKLNGGNSSGKYSILSPISGFIVEKNISSNMQLRVDNNQHLFAIADLSSVTAMVNIYESDIARIKEGDEVKVSILSYPDQTFTGLINKVYNTLDKDSKVMNAKVSISNPKLLLKPGMLATVKIQSKSGTNLPEVTSRGIIFDEDRNYVLKLTASNKIKIQQVEISRKSADKAYISKGLEAGDRIIASKQVFIYESLKN
jgi:cobalt-zinc-cadmium efflux system membrane fusion protein